jgi:hypothetical protein
MGSLTGAPERQRHERDHCVLTREGRIDGTRNRIPELEVRGFASAMSYVETNYLRAHNPEVAGSNPAPATAKGPLTRAFCFLI